MNINNYGLWGVIVLIADIYAIINIVGSSTEPLKKALWIVLILVLPVVGFIIWYFAGPKSAR
ncbi:MAG: PLD nuclease N-terminal domain-containing protein [Panacagrimonas sp.]